MHSLNIVLTDLHIGKTQDPQGKLNKYFHSLPNLELGKVRILLCGDLIESEGIFPTQAFVTGGISGIEQAEECVDCIDQFVRAVADYYGDVVELHGVYGNHGRHDKLAHPHSNWDNVVQWHLADRLRDVVDCSGIEDYREMRSVKGSPILMRHIGPKHAGTPAMLRYPLSWLAQEGKSILVLGHWHQVMMAEYNQQATVIYGGCLCGPDEYAIALGYYPRSAQVWFADDGHRVVMFGAPDLS